MPLSVYGPVAQTWSVSCSHVSFHGVGKRAVCFRFITSQFASVNWPGDSSQEASFPSLWEPADFPIQFYVLRDFWNNLHALVRLPLF